MFLKIMFIELEELERAGNSGDAISLVCIDEHDYLLGIEKLIKQKINKIAIEGFKVNPNIKAEPISNGRK